MNRYKASAALEAFIVTSAPPHYATPDAPSTFAELTAAHAKGGPLPVFDGGCDRTIYSTPAVNHAFRAWHDSLHVTLAAQFDEDGEWSVAAAQFSAAHCAGLPRGDCDALLFDAWGQVLYARQHAGNFPTDQAAFVAACFAHGIDAAARMNF